MHRSLLAYAGSRLSEKWDRPNLNRGHGHPRPEGYQATLQSRITTYCGGGGKRFVRSPLLVVLAEFQGRDDAAGRVALAHAVEDAERAVRIQEVRGDRAPAVRRLQAVDELVLQ